MSGLQEVAQLNVSEVLLALCTFCLGPGADYVAAQCIGMPGANRGFHPDAGDMGAVLTIMCVGRGCIPAAHQQGDWGDCCIARTRVWHGKVCLHPEALLSIRVLFVNFAGHNPDQSGLTRAISITPVWHALPQLLTQAAEITVEGSALRLRVVCSTEPPHLLVSSPPNNAGFEEGKRSVLLCRLAQTKRVLLASMWSVNELALERSCNPCLTDASLFHLAH